MTPEQFESLWVRLREMRAAHKFSSAGGIPPTIEFLRSLRERATAESDIIALTTLLESECSWYGLKDEQEVINREMTVQFPDHPMPWISLAGFLLYEKDEPGEAKMVIEIALEKALKTGLFLRHAYNTQARIARRLADYVLLEDILKKLSVYVPRPGFQDVADEDDFVKDIPERTVSTKVLDRYLQVVAERRNAK